MFLRQFNYKFGFSAVRQALNNINPFFSTVTLLQGRILLKRQAITVKPDVLFRATLQTSAAMLVF